MYDRLNETLEEVALAPVAITASGKSGWIDTKGADSLHFAVAVGVITAADSTNYLAISLEDADALDKSDAAAVAADYYFVNSTVGATAPRVNAAGQAGTIATRIGYRGNKRFVRASYDETGTFSAVVGIIAVKGGLQSSPPA